MPKMANVYAELELETEQISELEPDLSPKPVMAGQPKVYQVIRYISRKNVTSEQEGAYSVSEINFYLTEKINEGYKLFATHYLGEVPEGYGMLYVFVRE